jgi:hypothetical protein
MTEQADDYYFTLNLWTSDSTPIPPEKFGTVEQAMTAAKGYPNTEGEILRYGDENEPVTMVTYNADGTGYVSAEFFGDDPDYYDQPWTLEEVEMSQVESVKGSAAGTGDTVSHAA